MTNMPNAVYRCDLLKGRPLGSLPTNEVFVSGHVTIREAMEEANRLKRADPYHSYVVSGWRGQTPDDSHAVAWNSRL